MGYPPTGGGGGASELSELCVIAVVRSPRVFYTDTFPTRFGSSFSRHDHMINSLVRLTITQQRSHMFKLILCTNNYAALSLHKKQCASLPMLQGKQKCSDLSPLCTQILHCRSISGKQNNYLALRDISFFLLQLELTSLFQIKKKLTSI